MVPVIFPPGKFPSERSTQVYSSKECSPLTLFRFVARFARVRIRDFGYPCLFQPYLWIICYLAYHLVRTVEGDCTDVCFQASYDLRVIKGWTSVTEGPTTGGKWFWFKRVCNEHLQSLLKYLISFEYGFQCNTSVRFRNISSIHFSVTFSKSSSKRDAWVIGSFARDFLHSFFKHGIAKVLRKQFICT